MVIASVLIVSVGLLLTLLLVSRAASPTGQFGIDATDYLTAADRLAGGESPYAAEMLDGPIDSQGIDRYRYPPVFAQLLVPFTGIDRQAALWILVGVQVVAIAAAIAVALRTARLLRPEPILWAATATLLFLPAFNSLWKGNVSGFLALLVSLAVLGGATGGSAVALATLLKIAPASFVPAWFVARPAIAAGYAR